MSKIEHKWDTFYSPRNGRVSIQACNECGVAKGLVLTTHECTPVSDNLKNVRLKGWTTVRRMQQRNASQTNLDERLSA